tara:strand:- start:144 stop:485 length:342 start_codon:yes stop_codon:yes gene_type:complete
MEEYIVIIFTSLSFIIYGYSSFISRRMISEYRRWGFLSQRKTIGSLQIAGGFGLILGLKVNFLLLITSICFVIMMIFAIVVRIRIKDNITDILPAITYLFLNLLILYYSIFTF